VNGYMSFGQVIVYIWLLGSTYVLFTGALQSHKGVMWVLFGIWAIASLLFTLELLPTKMINKMIKQREVVQ